MASVNFNEEEVQCPLCLRYHNIQSRTENVEEEGEEHNRPTIGEIFGGTVKVTGAAGAVATLLYRQTCSKTESLSSQFSLGSLTAATGGDSPNFGRIAMGAMVLTGMIVAVWSWVYKQKIRRQREEEFRGNLEICKECWRGIRGVLCNGDH